MAVNPEGTDRPALPSMAPEARDAEAEAMLAQIFAPRVEEIADAIIAKLTLAFPQASVLGDEFAQDMMVTISDTLRRVIKLVGSGESFEQAGPLIEETARQRRRQAISQEMIFLGYRYIQQVVFDEVKTGIRDHPESLRLLDAMALRQLEFQFVVNRRVAAAFDSGADALAASREESIQRLLDELLGHRPASLGLEEQAGNLGLLTPMTQLSVTVAEGDVQRPGTLDEPPVRAVGRVNPWSVVGLYRSRIVVLGRGAPFGLTNPWGTVTLMPELLARPDLLLDAITFASAAADVAQRLGMEHADADEVAPFIAVAAISPDRQEAFLASLFGDLHTSSRGLPILKAVAVSASSAGRREAASRLQVHPNTLDYRLSRFRELTGINLSNPVQRLRCDLGLFLLGLLEE